MIGSNHDVTSIEDRRARVVNSLLEPALNKCGCNADNFELDCRIMLAGTLATADATFVQGCLTSCIEPDYFTPGARVAILSSADFAQWLSIRAAFIAAGYSTPLLDTVITR